jgi:hypothetical protein
MRSEVFSPHGVQAWSSIPAFSGSVAVPFGGAGRSRRLVSCHWQESWTVGFWKIMRLSDSTDCSSRIVRAEKPASVEWRGRAPDGSVSVGKFWSANFPGWAWRRIRLCWMGEISHLLILHPVVEAQQLQLYPSDSSWKLSYSTTCPPAAG